MSEGLSEEDAKLVTLARGARARIGAVTGAAVRDETGRTYSGADVRLESLSLSGLDLAVAQAAASGARGIEAAVVVGEALETGSIASVRDLGGPGVPVLWCAADGSVRERLTT